MKKNSLLVLLFIFIFSNTYGQISFVSGSQYGTDMEDVSSNVLADSLNNVFLSGSTAGLIGEKNHGGIDGLVCKYDSSGKMLWAKQLGSQYDDEINHLCFDNYYNIYLTGYYSTKENNKDVWVIKLDKEGEIIWEKTFGTDSTDFGRNIIVDDDGIAYITGYTTGDFGGTSKGGQDCFILSLNPDGEQKSIVQFGTDKTDDGYAITIGADSLLYVCGKTSGDLSCKNYGIMDAFWGTFTKELKQNEIYQFGSPGYDLVWLIRIDKESDILLAGSTNGEIAGQNTGRMDAYLRKMDMKGNLLWHKQFGTENGDYINGLVINGDGDIVISGCQNWSECQAYCRMYSKDGELLWEDSYKALGEEHGTCGKGLYMNSKGFLFHTGTTGGDLFSDQNGGNDMYLLKLKLDTFK